MSADGYGPDASQPVKLTRQLIIEMGDEIDLDADDPSTGGDALMHAAADAVDNLMQEALTEHTNG